MNTTLQVIYERRSVKHFDALHVIPDEIKTQIFDAAKQTPSSFNIQHWRLLDITDTNLRKDLRACAWNQAQVTDASMLVIVCVDVNAHAKDPSRYWQNAPKEISDYLVSAIGTFYDNKSQLQRDEAMRSAGLISQTIMLSAKALGYDSCPMVGFDFDKVASLIKLPSDHAIGMMIAIGKAAEPAKPKGGFLSDDEFVQKNHF